MPLMVKLGVASSPNFSCQIARRATFTQSAGRPPTAMPSIRSFTMTFSVRSGWVKVMPWLAADCIVRGAMVIISPSPSSASPGRQCPVRRYRHRWSADAHEPVSPSWQSQESRRQLRSYPSIPRLEYVLLMSPDHRPAVLQIPCRGEHHRRDHPAAGGMKDRSNARCATQTIDPQKRHQMHPAPGGGNADQRQPQRQERLPQKQEAEDDGCKLNGGDNHAHSHRTPGVLPNVAAFSATPR